MVIDCRNKTPKCFYCGNKLEIQKIHESEDIDSVLLPGTITRYSCKECGSIYSVYLPLDTYEIN